MACCWRLSFGLSSVLLACTPRAPVPVAPSDVRPAATDRATLDGSPDAAQAAGPFEGHGDVGDVLHPGSVVYDDKAHSYTVAGSGDNMWFANDAFQFVWTKVSGDFALTADVSFLSEGGNEHRKAVLVVRQTLDGNSVYADVARHGNGLTSLQYRDATGADTHEIESNRWAPTRLRIEKRGPFVYMSLAGDDRTLHRAGGAARIPIEGTFYVGLGVCSHDKSVVERAVFSNIELSTDASTGGEPTLYSTLETVAIASTDRRVVHVAPGRIEAPNWSHDGLSLLFDEEGRIFRIPVKGGTPEVVETGFAVRSNDDHGLSADGKWLAVSDESQEDHRSLIYVVPADGGTPRRVTKGAPSYFHGWSPDGKKLVFVGQRNDDFDVYSIAAAGGPEARLTTARGLDDGPEYSPDGKYVYFNSERTGTMQLWRMRPDGSGQEQVFADDHDDWFPHISPDGRWLVFLSYEKGVVGHPADKDVTLRLMSLEDRSVRVLAKLVGGQGTINVASWSPDSLAVAFVSYQWIRE